MRPPIDLVVAKERKTSPIVKKVEFLDKFFFKGKVALISGAVLERVDTV